MATRKTATKTTKKAEINLPSISKKNKQKIAKIVKNFSLTHIMIILIVFVLCFGIGTGAYFIVCRNDCFELIGEKEITLSISESYVDSGVKIIEFGKDVSSNVYIETNLEKNGNNEFFTFEAGKFYIKYLTSSIKFGKIFKVTKVRLITFTAEESEGGE